MALFVSSLLSAGPKIQRVDDQLHAVTGWCVWLMTLGLSNRRVIVDPNKKILRIHDRILWFFKRKRSFPFSRIRAIAYGYSDANPFAKISLAYDAFDMFDVGLKVHGDDNHYRHLFCFFGNGSFVNDSPFPNWWYWEEYLTDMSGTQESQSRHFVELLQRMTETTIEPI